MENEREKKFEEDKKRCLLEHMCKNPEWARTYLRKISAKNGTDAANKLRYEARQHWKNRKK